jgi:hypothetical protein
MKKNNPGVPTRGGQSQPPAPPEALGGADFIQNKEKLVIIMMVSEYDNTSVGISSLRRF